MVGRNFSEKKKTKIPASVGAALSKTRRRRMEVKRKEAEGLMYREIKDNMSNGPHCR